MSIEDTPLVGEDLGSIEDTPLVGADLDILCSIASDDVLLLVEETTVLADTVPPFMEDVALLVEETPELADTVPPVMEDVPLLVGATI